MDISIKKYFKNAFKNKNIIEVNCNRKDFALKEKAYYFKINYTIHKILN